jgi:hypothetical protein
MTPKLKALAAALSLLALSACRGGINAGGESETSNGGVAWIAMAGMLITIGIVLYIILGREE